MEQIEGIAGADVNLGRPFPLPALALPLARWTAVAALGGGVEIEWNLDDTRAGTPGRVALYAGSVAASAARAAGAVVRARGRGPGARRACAGALMEAQPSLRPVRELRWERGGLYLRLTARARGSSMSCSRWPRRSTP